MRCLLALLLAYAFVHQSHADSHLCADELSKAGNPKVGEILTCMAEMQSAIKDLKDELDNVTISDVSQFALKDEIPDHTNYVKIDDIPSFSGYAKKADLPDVSQFALKSEIPDHTNYAKIDDIPNLSGYAKKADLPKYILIGQVGDCPPGYEEVAKLQLPIWGLDGSAAVRVGWNVYGDVGGGYAATNPRLCYLYVYF